MLLFFYGADAYRSHRKLLQLKRKYIDASLGDTNLAHLDGAEVSADQLANALLALPFLAKTRLVILDRLLSRGPKALHEKFLDLIDQIPDSTVAVVYEPGLPDRRTVLFKKLLKVAKTEEFRPLVGRQLGAWMTELLGPYQATIEPAAAQSLAQRSNGESWRIASELGKLGTFLLDRPVEERVIDSSLVDRLTVDASATNVFALSDSLVASQPTASLGALRRLLGQGESPQLLLAMLASSFRSLALIRDSLDRGVAPPQLARTTGLAPFVVSKHRALAKRLTLGQVQEAMLALATLDLDSKRGRINAEVGLELFVIRMVTQPQIHSQIGADRSA